MSVRIGIAGCGSHALGRIIPAIEANDDLQLAAAWTRNPATRTLLENKGVPRVCEEFKQLLAEDLDVVYIASPTGCHAEHTAAALRAGHHAWVEKPLATTLADTSALVELADQSGRMLAEAFMFIWHPQADAITHALAQELPGDLRSVSLTFCFPHLPQDNIRYDPALGGGAWLDHACYLVRALHHYFPGEWVLLGGCIENDAHAVDVRGSAHLRRATDGATATLTWGFGHGYVNEMQVIGTRGRMLVDSAFTKPATRSCNLTIENSAGQRSTIAVPPANPYGCMLNEFARRLDDPAGWQRAHQDILAHAGRFFGLQDQLMTHLPSPLPRDASA